MRGIARIAAASVLATAAAAQEDPGTGALLATIGEERVPLPIVSLEVDLTITGTIVRGVVEQRFANPATEPLEAVYIFPLPEGAAVDGLTLDIGGRRFVGEIHERAAARERYERAKQEGKRAGLLEQHRANIFETAVAGIPPGAEVAVRLTYLDDADWQDGVFSTTFPLTITPRYTPGSSGRFCSTSVPSASVRVALDAGVPLASVTSRSHLIAPRLSGRAVSVELASVPADRDLVLYWKPESGGSPIAGAIVEEREGGRYVSVTVIPPELGDDAARGLPTQTVFVVDVSGSMEGTSIEQAREALLAALDRQEPGDTFTLIKFNNLNEAFHDGFVAANQAFLDGARAWVRDLTPGGGTEILPAILRALALSDRGDDSALRRVVLITDGAVGNEDEVLRAVEGALGGTRLHVVGIGAAPNRWLMKELATSGRGVAEFVGSAGEVRERIGALLERTERAVITDVAIEGTDAAAIEFAPDPIPDLYSGRPLVITARLAPGAKLPELTLWGRAPGGPVTIDLPIEKARVQAGIGSRWARARIESLEGALRRGADPSVVRHDVIELARRFSLVTAYTSFVVEDESDEVAIDELPACGTLEPLLLTLGAALALAGLALLGSMRLVRGTLV